MDLLQNRELNSVFQVIISLSVLKIWIINFNKPSQWRGGNAKTMKEEFEVYGLPDWCLYTVGFLKCSFSIGLIVGLWIPEIIQLSAFGIAFFMFFVIMMHIKIKDPIIKSLPEFILLILSVLIILLYEQ